MSMAKDNATMSYVKIFSKIREMGAVELKR
jgi:hypothetical protein